MFAKKLGKRKKEQIEERYIERQDIGVGRGCIPRDHDCDNDNNVSGNIHMYKLQSKHLKGRIIREILSRYYKNLTQIL